MRGLETRDDGLQVALDEQITRRRRPHPRFEQRAQFRSGAGGCKPVPHERIETVIDRCVVKGEGVLLFQASPGSYA